MRRPSIRAFDRERTGVGVSDGDLARLGRRQSGKPPTSMADTLRQAPDRRWSWVYRGAVMAYWTRTASKAPKLVLVPVISGVLPGATWLMK